MTNPVSHLSKATKRRPCFVSEMKSHKMSLGDLRKWCLGFEVTRELRIVLVLYLMQIYLYYLYPPYHGVWLVSFSWETLISNSKHVVGKFKFYDLDFQRKFGWDKVSDLDISITRCTSLSFLMLAIEVVLETCSKFAGYVSYQNRQTKAFYALPPDCDLPGLVEVYEFRKEANEAGWIQQVVVIPL